MCETFKIKHKNSIAYRLQMNGAVEAANKNIKIILRKIVDNYKQWHDKLPFALLGYRTTVRTSIGATPYLLVYGTEAVIPAKVEIPSLRIIQEAELSDAEWVQSRYEQLALIDEKIMNARSRRLTGLLMYYEVLKQASGIAFLNAWLYERASILALHYLRFEEEC
ncbi:uncharacterized protein LOC142163818 [Nicotiana tabacum]|uniref:Uncharacterized protein LOC142163818 n=1 Tax=Nicotiana tabacum TaxID=4097 RepID=A0AC58RWR9_TOBAC